MLINLSMPLDVNVYDKLRQAQDIVSQKRLVALEETMTHFQANDPTVAESLLRMDMKMPAHHELHGSDDKSKALIQMFDYFRSLLYNESK